MVVAVVVSGVVDMVVVVVVSGVVDMVVVVVISGAVDMVVVSDVVNSCVSSSNAIVVSTLFSMSVDE